MALFQENSRRRRSRAGFTLMEVLLVLIILVILGSLAATVITGTQDRANLRAATAQVALVKRAVNLYRLEMNKYPDQVTDLWTKPSDPKAAENWGTGYLDQLGKDPWDNDYRYAAPGKHNPDSFDFWSVGPDGQDGTTDDIGNWQTS